MQGPHLGPRTLQLDIPAVIDETDQAAPAFEALQNVAVLKNRLRLARHTYAEEGPKPVVEVLELGKIQAGALSSLRQDLRRELFAFLQLLGPCQEFEQDGDLTHEVSLNPRLPLRASFCSVELLVSTVGQLEVEDS